MCRFRRDNRGGGVVVVVGIVVVSKSVACSVLSILSVGSNVKFSKSSIISFVVDSPTEALVELSTDSFGDVQLSVAFVRLSSLQSTPLKVVNNQY